jgi:hypothetical protein
MKTFQWFMEQVLAPQQAKIDAAKVRAQSLETRQHNRYANLQRLHTTMHLQQTANQEKRSRGL